MCIRDRFTPPSPRPRVVVPVPGSSTAPRADVPSTARLPVVSRSRRPIRAPPSLSTSTPSTRPLDSVHRRPPRARRVDDDVDAADDAMDAGTDRLESRCVDRVESSIEIESSIDRVDSSIDRVESSIDRVDSSPRRRDGWTLVTSRDRSIDGHDRPSRARIHRSSDDSTRSIERASDLVVALSGSHDPSWSPSACPPARADGCEGGTRGRARRERGTRARTTEGDARGGGRGETSVGRRRRAIVRARERRRRACIHARTHALIHSFARWAFEFRARERRGET